MDKRVAILGGGSWATALAKIVMMNQDHINWFMRKQMAINEFQATGKNPGYLTNAKFDTSRITFSSDINKTIANSDILIMAIPSPYILQTLKKIRRSITNKTIISAVKGMIPDENMLITDYLHVKYGVPTNQLAIIAGPCHAEEIALERLSYLTIGCKDIDYARQLGELFETDFVRTTPSTDVTGLEYSSVLKNIYAIAAGMCHSLRYGDNFQAVLISNAIQELRRFAAAMEQHPDRHITSSGYLGDVLVTAYSKFSRNRQFGQMIGMGYSVKAAQTEMEMVAEGYYGTRAIHAINERAKVDIPIVEAVYDILFNQMSPTIVIKELTQKLH